MRFDQKSLLARVLLALALLTLVYFSANRSRPTSGPDAGPSTSEKRPNYPDVFGPDDDEISKYQPENDSTADSPPRSEADEQPAKVSPLTTATTVRRVIIRDENRQVVYRGDIDLRQTLERIAKGERLRFHNDGSVFQNRERRLPHRPEGYYHEFVHPTPRLNGPGPQRVITGETGEVYYTPDHYRTFERLNNPAPR